MIEYVEIYRDTKFTKLVIGTSHAEVQTTKDACKVKIKNKKVEIKRNIYWQKETYIDRTNLEKYKSILYIACKINRFSSERGSEWIM